MKDWYKRKREEWMRKRKGEVVEEDRWGSGGGREREGMEEGESGGDGIKERGRNE
jgi:hypothetical protein